MHQLVDVLYRLILLELFAKSYLSLFGTSMSYYLHVHLHLSRLYKGIGLIDRANSVGEHHTILNALQAKDKEVAVELLSHHIHGVEGRLRSLLAG